MNKRYALRKLIDGRNAWSIGNAWSYRIPDADDLLTGRQVDEIHGRHLDATIIDVVVHRQKLAVWSAAFRLATVKDSTHEQRQAARSAAANAVAAAGFSPLQ